MDKRSLLEQELNLQNLGNLSNTHLGRIHQDLHAKLGERHLWLKRIAPDIRDAKMHLVSDPPLHILEKRQRQWRKDMKALIQMIDFVEAEMDRRLNPN